MSDMTPVEVEGALACDYATETAVGLLDSLLDTMAIAKPGRDAATIATDLYRLADGAAFVAQEVMGLVDGKVAELDLPQRPEVETVAGRATATVANPKDRAAAG